LPITTPLPSGRIPWRTTRTRQRWENSLPPPATTPPQSAKTLSPTRTIPLPSVRTHLRLVPTRPRWANAPERPALTRRQLAKIPSRAASIRPPLARALLHSVDFRRPAVPAHHRTSPSVRRQQVLSQPRTSAPSPAQTAL